MRTAMVADRGKVRRVWKHAVNGRMAKLTAPRTALLRHGLLRLKRLINLINVISHCGEGVLEGAVHGWGTNAAASAAATSLPARRLRCRPHRRRCDCLDTTAAGRSRQTVG